MVAARTSRSYASVRSFAAARSSRLLDIPTVALILVSSLPADIMTMELPSSPLHHLVD